MHGDSMKGFFKYSCVQGGKLHGRSDSNARHLVLETSALPTELHPYLRRERDSNPRYLTVQRFSRPPQSTTLPSLLDSECKSKPFFRSAKKTLKKILAVIMIKSVRKF